MHAIISEFTIYQGENKLHLMRWW